MSVCSIAALHSTEPSLSHPCRVDTGLELNQTCGYFSHGTENHTLIRSNISRASLVNFHDQPLDLSEALELVATSHGTLHFSELNYIALTS
nr:hypothetical protein Iba_chr01bCG12880 [Ipomoea batatas]GMC55705.1 hypothetical protein Iba_chr01fCG0240 [Ipomoea batatas]